ncbi:phosphotransferase [Nocardia ignorata]|uniref:phosphotransferase n=1 Tax=Nocardia ignorata TaxID=145285 RepID=UPI00363CC7CD
MALNLTRLPARSRTQLESSSPAHQYCRSNSELAATVAGVITIDDVLDQACRSAGFCREGARLLHAHSNSVWLLPSAVIARINRADHRGIRARESVSLTRWLSGQGIPVTEPAHNEAVVVGDFVVTFWCYYPQAGHVLPTIADLGRLLRMLHQLPTPPFPVPSYVPLAGLTEVLESTDASVLNKQEHNWLTDRTVEARDGYVRFDSALGVGFVHGDAYIGNTLRGPEGTVLLGDWDEAAIAPRELDLANTFQSASRFGELDIAEFIDAYGRDPGPGVEVLVRMRDLHTLGAYIRRAASGDEAAEDELHHRIRTMRDLAHVDEPWHVVS